MKSLNQMLGAVFQLLTFTLSATLAPPPLLAFASDISNSATAGGDNLSSQTSNQVVVTTGQTALELIKTGDRAAAEPGDTVVYRLALKNTGTIAANNISLTDTLPLGLRFLSQSLQASVTSGGTTSTVAISPATVSGRTITITYPSLVAKQTLNIVYAVIVTPDAVRGTGRNQAQEPRSNIASHLLRIKPGILSECGTIIGRVFVDKNADGEQQTDEPGVPNAVVFMDDGNRIMTDANGMFSLANVIGGNRVGTLDLNSIPGYQLAENKYFIERNSQSRLVRLEPGGLVRMNFAVTPVVGEAGK
jgi:uncharacterized repeat protein (TIGR01451 family)